MGGEGRAAAASAWEEMIRNLRGLGFSAYGQELILPIAKQYKHVGSTTRVDGRVCNDVAAKASSIKTSGNGLKRLFLASADIPADVKLGVARTHVFPIGEFSSGEWGPLTKPEFDCYAPSVVDIYMIVDRCERKPPAACGPEYVFKSDAKVVSDLSVLSPVARLALARIRFFALIVARRHTFLLTLAYAGRSSTKSWWRALTADMEWVVAGSGKLGELRLSGVAGWLDLFRSNGPKAMCTVQAATLECCRKQEEDERRAMAHGGGAAAARVADLATWQCTECGDFLNSYHAMVCHRARSHGILRACRKKIVDSTCPVCLRAFAHRTGVLNHLYKQSDICLLNVELYYRDLPPDVVAEADALQTEAEQACRARKEVYDFADTLCSQAEGPMMPFLIPCGHSRQSRFKKFRRMLRCRKSCREVSFQALRNVMAGVEEDVDDIPFDVLAAAW